MGALGSCNPPTRVGKKDWGGEEIVDPTPFSCSCYVVSQSDSDV
jgi:hypothetical protein